MKRIMLLVTAALVMAAMTLAMAMPAFADRPVYRCNAFGGGSTFVFLQAKDAKAYESAGRGTCERVHQTH
jgi:hypothetical protein